MNRIALVGGTVALGTVFIVLATRGNTPMDAKVKFAKFESQLSHYAEPKDFIRLKFVAHDYLENLVLPPSFRRLNNQLWSAYSKQDYLTCAKLAEKMGQIIPNNYELRGLVPRTATEPAFMVRPKVGSMNAHEYPFGNDFLIEWRICIGEFKALGNDYEGALGDFNLASSMVPLRSSRSISVSIRGSDKLQDAAYKQAKMFALLGNRDACLERLKKAPGLYWSGCGNCMEGESHFEDRFEKVYWAATASGAQAERELWRLADGGYKPLKGELNGDNNSYEEVFAARTEATFMLGELYYREGKYDLAKAAFKAVSAERFTENAKMSQSRLRTIASLSSKSK
ncbi:MAG: hypothetical protein WCG75_05290 [Armatimonadota bacterium]